LPQALKKLSGRGVSSTSFSTKWQGLETFLIHLASPLCSSGNLLRRKNKSRKKKKEKKGKTKKKKKKSKPNQKFNQKLEVES
jgi:hypothetical protein